MSEPDSGSDLASIRTRAIPVCGGYEVTGAKVWTSYAHELHYAITLVRTGASSIRKTAIAGLSQLIVDLKAPGVTIRPILNLAGEHDFNEIVLDRVFVPSERLVGRRGRRLAAGDQRTRLRAQRPGAVSVARIRCWSGWSSAPATIRTRAWPRRSAAWARNLWTLRQMSLSVAGMLQAGETPNLEAALVKDLGGAFERDVPELARALTPAAPPAGRWRPVRGGAGRSGAACAVLDIARRHPRDPARHHRPRPRAALSAERAMRDTILYDSALRLFGDHVTPQVLAAAESGDLAGRRCGGRWTRPAISTCSPRAGGMVEAVDDPARRRPSRRADPAGRNDAGALAVRRVRDRARRPDP